MITSTIWAKNYSKAKAPRRITLIVIHTMETMCKPGVARAIAGWFGSAKAPQASAHYCVDPLECIRCVRDDDVAWHVGRMGNGPSIGIELAGRASFTPEDWQREPQQAMLRRAASLVAELCCRWNIEPVHRGPEELKAGIGGLTGHVDITRGLGGTDHVDPGAAFPWDQFTAMVREAMTPPVD
jgi:N-acetyl-anhydromuramyl-L-alanine amidase AmpD